jgi:PAS domain S-box-containing protein
VNRTECEWLGYPESELLGRPVWELVAEDERGASEIAVRRKLASSGALTPFCRTYQRRDGTSVVFQISERRMLNGDTVQGICSIMIPL